MEWYGSLIEYLATMQRLRGKSDRELRKIELQATQYMIRDGIYIVEWESISLEEAKSSTSMGRRGKAANSTRTKAVIGEETAHIKRLSYAIGGRTSTKVLGDMFERLTDGSVVNPIQETDSSMIAQFLGQLTAEPANFSHEL